MKPVAIVNNPPIIPSVIPPMIEQIPVRRMLHSTSGRDGFDLINADSKPTRMPSPPRMFHSTSGRHGFGMLTPSSGRDGFGSMQFGNANNNK